jgi:hypothetical protein
VSPSKNSSNPLIPTESKRKLAPSISACTGDLAILPNNAEIFHFSVPSDLLTDSTSPKKLFIIFT